MSTMKKVMHYLGLGPDDDYQSAPAPLDAHDRLVVSSGEGGASLGDLEGSGDVRPLGPVESSGLTAVPATSGADQRSPSLGGGRLNTVRPIPAGSMTSLKPAIIEPLSFNDAQEIGDKFRNAKPVVMDLRNAQRDLARRLIDFSSGLCYGLRGDMEKVGDKVYLLTPEDIEISPEDRIELREQGLVDG